MCGHNMHAIALINDGGPKTLTFKMLSLNPCWSKLDLKLGTVALSFFFLFFCIDLDYTELEFIGSFQITNWRDIVTLTNSLTSKKTLNSISLTNHAMVLSWGLLKKFNRFFLMSV